MYLLKTNQRKLKTFESSLFIVQSYFNNDGSQNYLILQPIYKTITKFFVPPDTNTE